MEVEGVGRGDASRGAGAPGPGEKPSSARGSSGGGRRRTGEIKNLKKERDLAAARGAPEAQLAEMRASMRGSVLIAGLRSN